MRSRMTTGLRLLLLSTTIATAVLAYIFWAGEVIDLRAEEAIPVGREFNMPYPYSGANLLYTIKLGERVPVSDCISDKSDIGLTVRVADGQEGYVLAGEFLLERRAVDLSTLIHSPNRIVFCKGWFENRTTQATRTRA